MTDTEVATEPKLNKDGTVRKPREVVDLPDLKLVKTRKNEEPPVGRGRGRGISEDQQKVRNMVAELTHGEWFKIPVSEEKEQRALISHLRNAITATHEGMGVGIATDESNVWFRIQPKSARGRKAEDAE